MSIYDIPIYIINLKTEKKRLHNVKKELKKIGDFKNINFFDAIDSDQAEKISFSYIDYVSYENITKKLLSTKILPTWSSVGCAISHYKCWELIHKNYEEKKYEYNYGIIVEDDIIIEDIIKFKYKLHKVWHIFNRIDNDPILFLFDSVKNIFFDNTNSEYSDTNSENITNSYNIEDIQIINNEFTNTHFYFININYIKNLLKYLLPIKFQIDIELGRHIFKLRNIINLPTFNLIDSGIRQDKTLISNVQYHFHEKIELYQLFESDTCYLPYELCDIIYDYLPKKFIEPLNFYEKNIY